MTGTSSAPITLCLKNFLVSVVCRHIKIFWIKIKFGAMYTLLM